MYDEPRLAADREEDDLAAVDLEFHDYYGPNEKTWVPWQRENYLDAIAEVHAKHHPEQAVA